MRLLAAAVVVATVLAGCSGSGPSPSAGPCGMPSCGADAVAANRTAALPTWRVGNWWNFTSPLGGTSFSHIVSGETATDWIMDTDNPSSAFRNAREDTSYLGPVRKSDLAGSQGSERVEYMQWPLVDNKTWSTTWDGQPLGLRARLVVGDGAEVRTGPRFLIEARHLNGTLYASYVYDAQVGWFRTVTFYDDAGEAAFTFELAKYGHQYPGSVVRWRLETVVAAAGPLSSVGVASSDFAVPLNATDVWVSYRLTCSTGPAGVGVAPLPFFSPTDPRRAGAGPGACPQDVAFAGSVGAPVAPPSGGDETWGWEVNGSPATDGTFSLTVYIRWKTVATVDS